MNFGRFTREDVEILASGGLHEGFVRVQRHRVRHRLFAGGWSQPQEREVVHQSQSATVLPYDPGRELVVLIEQFRLPALLAGGDPWQIEVVAGLLDKPDEAPEAVARREAQEEAGLEVTALDRVGSLLSSPGASTEVIHHFIGKVDAGAVDGLHGLLEEQEDIRPQVLPLETAWAMLEAGEIGNAPAWICLAWLKLHHERLRAAWL